MEAAGHGSSALEHVILPLEQCFLLCSLCLDDFQVFVSHAWNHNGNVTCPLPTESEDSGDLKKDAVFVFECNCRFVCTCVV